MSLTIEQILAAQDRAVEEVAVPEWGGTVYVRRMSANESVDFVVSLRNVSGSDTDAMKERLAASLAAFLCDADGKSLATLEQARELAKKSAGPVNRIVKAGHALNATDEKQTEETAKNSEPSPDGILPTG